MAFVSRNNPNRKMSVSEFDANKEVKELSRTVHN